MELLSPAGNLPKAYTAFLYGADAVYLAGQDFGLRYASDNFTTAEIAELSSWARPLGKKIFLALNSYLHDEELARLPDFLASLNDCGIDAVIVSDLGVFQVVRQFSEDLPIHISTQASCLNVESAKMWCDWGAKRIVLGREVSLKEAQKIKNEVPIEIEMFVHGSMCMAYSGNCVISNYTSGRDSNRGGCAHSCRFDFTLAPDNGQKPFTRAFMSSKDLKGLDLLADYIQAGVDSIKIEGRMKGPLYVATVTKAYRQALDGLKADPTNQYWKENIEDELKKFSHREYCSGSLKQKAGDDSIYKSYSSSGEVETDIVGTIREVYKDEFAVVEVLNSFRPKTPLEVVTFNGKAKKLSLDTITDLQGEKIMKTKPCTLIKIPYSEGFHPYNVVRAPREAR